MDEPIPEIEFSFEPTGGDDVHLSRCGDNGPHPTMVRMPVCASLRPASSAWRERAFDSSDAVNGVGFRLIRGVLIEYRTTNDDFAVEMPVAAGEVRNLFSPSSIDFGRVEQSSPAVRRAVCGQSLSSVSGIIPDGFHDFVRLVEGADGRIAVELKARAISGRFHERIALTEATQNGGGGPGH